MKIIEFYKTIDGKSPVEEFFDSLNSGTMQKVAWTLQLIKDIGIVPQQYLKKLVGSYNLWEIRVVSSGKQIRILCFMQKNNLIILTSGFIKKTNKIPVYEIEKAKIRMLDYIKRKAL